MAHTVASYHGAQFGLFSSRSLRTAEWKYVWSLTDVDELYHLENDLWELRNPAVETKLEGKLSELRGALAKELEASNDPLSNPGGPTWEQLRELYEMRQVQHVNSLGFGGFPFPEDKPAD